MAIILEKKNKNTKVIIWISAAVLILAALAIGAWYSFSALDFGFLSFDMLKQEKQLPEDMLEPYVRGNFIGRLQVNQKLLEDPRLKSLREFIELPIKIGVLGKQNPFVTP